MPTYHVWRTRTEDYEAFVEAENEDELNKLKQQLEESIHAGVEIEYCSISRFINGEIVETVIIDNGPKVDGAGFTEQDR